MNYWKLKAALEKRDRKRAELELAWQQEVAAFAETFRAEGLDPAKGYAWNDATETFTEKVNEPKAG